MTAEQLTHAFVWTWPPGSTDPVVAGRIDDAGDLVSFTYEVSYLAREDAVPLYLPELPLHQGPTAPLGLRRCAGVVEDAGPDAWGQRVVMRQRFGPDSDSVDPAALGRLSYLLETGSDRIGALDFQRSGEAYLPRFDQNVGLEELAEAARLIDAGGQPAPERDRALRDASAVGGARPKALLTEGGRKLIAKFSSASDTYPVVKGEFLAMELARRAGLRVPGVSLFEVAGRDVLLVERFDREAVNAGFLRRPLVSALTILGLDGEREARYASYSDLADQIRARFTEPELAMRELFARIIFNVLVGNIDDHAKNHAAFWDGHSGRLTLTPAYDICPQPRSGRTARQAMAFSPGVSDSQLELVVQASDLYGLTERQAREIVDHQVQLIAISWEEVADRAELSAEDRAFFKGRQFLNPYAFEGYPAASPWR
jgi:serine/threonine-protein kinase HipA